MINGEVVPSVWNCVCSNALLCPLEVESTNVSPSVSTMQPEGSLPASLAGAPPPSSPRGGGRTTNLGVSTPSSMARLPEARKAAGGEPSKWGLKKASSILLELEAGKREAEERNALNSKLCELGTELSKVRYCINTISSRNCASWAASSPAS